jgi:mitochondrial intermembrane space import and assembly protein 40
MDTNKSTRKHRPSNSVPFNFTIALIAIVEKPKVVDHVAHIEPVPVTEPEQTSEQTNPPATTQDDEQPEGEPGQPQPGAAAYNPDTGEINWDCPCLGGMAHGPCGMQFREAFSCFVFSEQEPKGIDCVEKFKAMQDCFREHPDIYAEGGLTVSVTLESVVPIFPTELDDDDDPHPANEPPETAELVTGDTSLDTPHESTPIKVHTEP